MSHTELSPIGKLVFAYLFMKYFIMPYKRLGEGIYNLITLPNGRLQSFYAFEALAMMALILLALSLSADTIPLTFGFPNEMEKLLKKQTFLMLIERALYIATLVGSWCAFAYHHMYIYMTMKDLPYTRERSLGDIFNEIRLTLEPLREEKMTIAQAERAPQLLNQYQRLVNEGERGMAEGMVSMVREGYTQLYETPPPYPLVYYLLVSNHEHITGKPRIAPNRLAIM